MNIVHSRKHISVNSSSSRVEIMKSSPSFSELYCVGPTKLSQTCWTPSTTKSMTRVLRWTCTELWALACASLASSLEECSSSFTRLALVLWPESMIVLSWTGTHSTPVDGCFTIFRFIFSLMCLRLSAWVLKVMPLGLFSGLARKVFRSWSVDTCHRADETGWIFFMSCLLCFEGVKNGIFERKEKSALLVLQIGYLYWLDTGSRIYGLLPSHLSIYLSFYLSI